MINLSRQTIARSLAVALVLLLVGCGDSTGPEEPPIVAPGAVLPLDTTVRITQPGDYLLPAGAASLTTRCWGLVTVTYTPPGGTTQDNTCETNPPDGSANQTNPVSGVSSVTYALGPGAYAHVTVE